MSEERGRLIEASEHLRDLINHAGAGHCSEGEVLSRHLAFLNADDTKRSIFRKDHFVIPERASFTDIEEEHLRGNGDPKVGRALYEKRTGKALQG